MTKQLRSIGVASCAKTFALLYGIIGLLAGGVFSVLAALGAATGAFGELQGGGIFGLLLGVGSVIFFPILYGIMGAIDGVVMAGLYNIVSRAVGGIELEIE